MQIPIRIPDSGLWVRAEGIESVRTTSWMSEGDDEPTVLLSINECNGDTLYLLFPSIEAVTETALQLAGCVDSYHKFLREEKNNDG